jgi:hypothetical protein
MDDITIGKLNASNSTSFVSRILGFGSERWIYPAATLAGALLPRGRSDPFHCIERFAKSCFPQCNWRGDHHGGWVAMSSN